MRFFAINNMMDDYRFPIVCTEYKHLGGNWIGFFADDFLRIAISCDHFFFEELTEEEYNTALAVIENSEEESEEPNESEAHDESIPLE